MKLVLELVLRREYGIFREVLSAFLGQQEKIEDYLKYSEERKRQACEKFISAIEGEKANDRNSNSNWDGNILHGYK